MSSISGPSDGPVAVTGASGFIGAHVVKNLVEHGYTVHACLRDTSRKDKTSYLLDIDKKGPGHIKLFACDLFKSVEGDYDEGFAGCLVVFHLAADIGTDAATYGKPSTEKEYDGLMATSGVLESCRKAGTVKRVVYTSSTAAVAGPGEPAHPKGYIFTEDDWSGGTYETLEQRHTGPDGKTSWTREGAGYAKGKVDAEKACYAFGEDSCIDVISVCPSMVLGPLLGGPETLFLGRLSKIMKGESDMEQLFAQHWGPGLSWNIIDVRDIAETQRLIAESDRVENGTRYVLGAADESGELFGVDFIEQFNALFPKHNVAGGFKPEPTDACLRVRCTKAIKELGLVTHSTTDTLRDAGNSLIALGFVPAEIK